MGAAGSAPVRFSMTSSSASGWYKALSLACIGRFAPLFALEMLVDDDGQLLVPLFGRWIRGKDKMV
jgi:hypothetical protein